MSERNRQVVTAFYEAFAKKDGATMAAAYAKDATFEDPVFGPLTGAQAGAMWRMLCRSKDLQLTHGIDDATGDTVKAHWVARYTFPPTGKKIENHIAATLRLKDGLIVDHRDVFDLGVWLKQAYGPVARLPLAPLILGRLTSGGAHKNLKAFMAKGA